MRFDRSGRFGGFKAQIEQRERKGSDRIMVFGPLTVDMERANSIEEIEKVLKKNYKRKDKIMKTTMILTIIKQIYKSLLRDIIVKAVKESDNEVDDHIVAFIDLLLKD